MRRLLLFLVLAALSFSATAQRAWGLYHDEQSASITLDPEYQYSSANGAITGQRLGVGSYELTIPNMGKENTGVVHATPYGGSHFVQIQSWYAFGNDLKIRILSFDGDGNAVDGKFTFLYYKENRAPGSFHSAYQWGNAAANKMTPVYAYNSAGKKNRLLKMGVGEYRLTLPDVGPTQNDQGMLGNIQITAFGTSFRHAVVGRNRHTPNGLVMEIFTYGPKGKPEDAQFMVSYISDFNIGQSADPKDQDYGAYTTTDNKMREAAPQPTETTLRTSSGFIASPSYDANNAFINPTYPALTVDPVDGQEGLLKVVLPNMINRRSVIAVASSFTRNLNTTIQSIDKEGKNTIVYLRQYDYKGEPKSGGAASLFYYTNRNIRN